MASPAPARTPSRRLPPPFKACRPISRRPIPHASSLLAGHLGVEFAHLAKGQLSRCSIVYICIVQVKGGARVFFRLNSAPRFPIAGTRVRPLPATRGVPDAWSLGENFRGRAQLRRSRVLAPTPLALFSWRRRRATQTSQTAIQGEVRDRRAIATPPLATPRSARKVPLISVAKVRALQGGSFAFFHGLTVHARYQKTPRGGPLGVSRFPPFPQGFSMICPLGLRSLFRESAIGVREEPSRFLSPPEISRQNSRTLWFPPPQSYRPGPSRPSRGTVRYFDHRAVASRQLVPRGHAWLP
jgi:hypothetical protein